MSSAVKPWIVVADGLPWWPTCQVLATVCCVCVYCFVWYIYRSILVIGFASYRFTGHIKFLPYHTYHFKSLYVQGETRDTIVHNIFKENQHRTRKIALKHHIYVVAHKRSYRTIAVEPCSGALVVARWCIRAKFHVTFDTYLSISDVWVDTKAKNTHFSLCLLNLDNLDRWLTSVY